MDIKPTSFSVNTTREYSDKALQELLSLAPTPLAEDLVHTAYLILKKQKGLRADFENIIQRKKGDMPRGEADKLVTDAMSFLFVAASRVFNSEVWAQDLLAALPAQTAVEPDVKIEQPVTAVQERVFKHSDIIKNNLATHLPLRGLVIARHRSDMEYQRTLNRYFNTQTANMILAWLRSEQCARLPQSNILDMIVPGNIVLIAPSDAQRHPLHRMKDGRRLGYSGNCSLWMVTRAEKGAKKLRGYPLAPNAAFFDNSKWFAGNIKDFCLNGKAPAGLMEGLYLLHIILNSNNAVTRSQYHILWQQRINEVGIEATKAEFLDRALVRACDGTRDIYSKNITGVL